MRSTTRLACGTAMLFLVAMPAAAAGREGAAPEGPGGARHTPTICVVPFLNASGAPNAVETVMPEVWRVLESRGFTLVGNGRIEDFLRNHRIRARHAMTLEQKRDLAREMRADYILAGTIDFWAMNAGPEVALSARIQDPEDGALVWTGAANLHAPEAPGLLAMGRPKTLPAATRNVVRKLFAAIRPVAKDRSAFAGLSRRLPSRSLLAEAPISWRRGPLDRDRPLRIAIMPLANRTRQPEASVIVGDHLLAWLLSTPEMDVVDPGEVRRVFIEKDVQPLYGIGVRELAVLREELDIDALMDGAILEFENGGTQVPRIDLFVRLRDASSNEVIWLATTVRHGEQIRSFYDMGRIQSMDRLADAAVGDLLYTLLR